MFDGKNILAPTQDVNLLRAKIGMVFQKPTPFPMTIYDNIAFGVRLYENAVAAARWTTASNGRCARRRCGTRSRTSCSRAAWRCPAASSSACASRARIAVKPEVLLLDEPTSALDPISTAKIEELINELKRDYTIAIVTHNMQQAARISRLHRLHVPGRTGRVRRHRRRSSSSRSQETEDYITGRFG